MTTSYQKISGFDRPHVSEMLSDSKISTLECGFKNFRIRLRIRRVRVDDSRIRKYPDTCGRGLRSVSPQLGYAFGVSSFLETKFSHFTSSIDTANCFRTIISLETKFFICQLYIQYPCHGVRSSG